MPAFPPRRNALSIFSAACFALTVALSAGRVSAFVFLDTSDPGRSGSKDTASKVPASAPAVLPRPGPATAPVPDTARPAEAVPSDSRKALPHYRNVMFLSADDKLVYAYLGVWKAMEEFGLAPDAMLSESKAVLIGAAWALGYSAAGMEAKVLAHPLEDYLRPDPGSEETGRSPAITRGPDPLQWDIPLGLQSLQTPGSRWSDVTVGGKGEYLNLAWMVARLTHDAPEGPVEDLSKSRRRLAVQVSDLASDQEVVVTDGPIQSILKGSLLPTAVVRDRERLWPYASGALLSGHTVMQGKLPFTCDRVILLQPGHHLRPPSLEGGPATWIDSLNLRTLRRGAAAAGREDASSLDGAHVLRIELEPEGEFDPAETDPRRWINLGYISALRSMDVLQSVLSKDASRGGSGNGSRGASAEASGPAEGRLGLNRLSVNPLASGGRQLLLDIIRVSERDKEDSTGEGAIAALTGSGFYSDLDLEWAKGSPDENAVLVFDAKEKSKVRFRAGWNASFNGEDLPYRPPELFGGLFWSEPFYIPFQGEVGGLIGGHRPGYQARLMIAPVYPLHLELGVDWTHWEIFHSNRWVPRAAEDLGAYSVRLDRNLSEVFLKIFPMPSMYLRTAIQKHDMFDAYEQDPQASSFLSTDFQETVFLGLGKADRAGVHPHAVRLRYKNTNRVNLFGPVKFSTSDFESRVRFSLGDFHFSDQFYWSNQTNQDLAIFDLVEAGEIEVFTFQDEFFFNALRSANFQDAKIEYGPTFGKLGLRLILGGYRNYEPAIFLEQAAPHRWNGREIPFTPHWEAQAGYVTPLGTVRAGFAGIEGGVPFFYLRLGAGLKLGFDGAE
jgi:hypothetical protein